QEHYQQAQRQDLANAMQEKIKCLNQEVTGDVDAALQRIQTALMNPRLAPLERAELLAELGSVHLRQYDDVEALLRFKQALEEADRAQTMAPTEDKTLQGLAALLNANQNDEDEFDAMKQMLGGAQDMLRIRGVRRTAYSGLAQIYRNTDLSEAAKYEKL